MAKTIKTSGELRDFLIDAMIGVKNGHMDTDTARNVVKLAGQINESIYSEIKTARLLFDQNAEPPELGNLNIGKTELSGGM